MTTLNTSGPTRETQLAKIKKVVGEDVINYYEDHQGGEPVVVARSETKVYVIAQRDGELLEAINKDEMHPPF